MKKLFVAVMGCCMACCLYAQPDMKSLIEDNLRFAEKQYAYMASLLPKDSMPKTFSPKTQKLVSSDIQWWCSGFYAGSLWYIYEYTGNQNIRQEAERALQIIEPNRHYTGNHDLGFMMYCSYGNAYRITNNPAYKPILLDAAAALTTRYRPSIKAIQSWDSGKSFKCPVIVDNMMNLELLEWASLNGGGATFSNIAITHANTTLANHFRPDYSAYHVLDYNLATGQVSRKTTAQGAADSSAWARGQGWALYGYTMMYRFTKDERYLNLARNLAGFILNNPNLPQDKVPYWDFDAPGIPDALRDASAASLFASALLELSTFVNGAEKKQFVSSAETMLRTLSSGAYRAEAGTNGGFLLMHSVGALPYNSEVDVPLTYADYYFLEALLRYKKWYLD
ncbi:glycoside hydrolase family 88 protein [Foetidibacter luteolus]|uniref:glycoside hydrolase family 88 protein n=1 Tax=Foetidibacter luteolus TaxID=2608880 RepID=UPI00129BF8B2|nr:glycoside hydrolase family 88 protein [Foetidibacter luteolus]